MKFGINCGHTKSGPGSGAVGRIVESDETRNVGYKLMDKFRANGHTVVDCTINSASSQNAYLSQAVNLANQQDLDYFISIHFNAGGGRGVETYTYEGRQFADALETCENIAALGFRNRGVKAGTGLYVIRKTKAKSMLIEVCFVDTDDANYYLTVGADAVAQAIYNAVVDVNNGTASEGNTAVDNVNNGVANASKDIIKAGQQHSINFTGHAIATDGIWGPKTKANAIRCVQNAMNLDYSSGLAVDGIWGTKSNKALGNHYVKRGETQYMVTAVEILLMLRGYNPNGVECPGIFASGLETAVRQYQKDAGLKVDGIAGKNTIKSLMNI